MLSMLNKIFIAPIELIVEIVFEFVFSIVGQRQHNQGIALIGVSLAISFMTLPLYRRADIVQQKEREIQKKLSYWVKHIKENFKGDERFMILQQYYRINGYSPFNALNGSLSLLLEVPFFIAAYHFLSNLNALNEVSFGPIKDLGAADSLIKLNFSTYSIAINVLPILMTLINCISSAIYLKGFPVRDKIQTYGMAFIFLILLYNSPSGLVVYWTSNNIFGLIKNIFYKLKNPKKIFALLLAGSGTLFNLFIILFGNLNSRKKYILILLFQIIILIPLFFYFFKNKISLLKVRFAENKIKVIFKINEKQKYGSLQFLLFGFFLVFLLGVLIPSGVISSSPAEFVDLQNYKNPLYYVLTSTFYSIGFFIVWFGIIRYIMPEHKRCYLNLVLWIICGTFLLTYMCFGKNRGILSSSLIYEKGLNISNLEKILNLAAIFALCFFMLFLFKFRNLINMIALVCTIAIGAISITQVYHTQSILNKMSYIKDGKNEVNSNSVFTFSQKGRNVIVFMLDRAISGYVPYIFEEKPEVKKQFEGFTYYPNTISFGIGTQIGTPPLFGGYEYTPEEINKRSDDSLVEKHNEALKVMPEFFGQNNFNVVVCDPPYANYKWIPDISIYDDCKNVKAYLLTGNIKNKRLLVDDSVIQKSSSRTFFAYSIFKTAPLIFADELYDDGNYFSSEVNPDVSDGFYKEYSVLTMLSELTAISTDADDNFLMIQNGTTHEPCMLQLPDYELREKVDNNNYSTAADGKINMETNSQIVHYHANMAAFIALGKWFDFLRENEVWDNTRIIIVADHGCGNEQFDNLIMKNPSIDVAGCNPLFMVKDFYDTESKISNEFMTHADVPFMATKNIVKNPRNPFTNKLLNNSEKYSHPQKILWYSSGGGFEVSDTASWKTFSWGTWYSVHDNIFKEENWKQLE